MKKLLKNTWVKMAGVLLFAVLMTAAAFFGTAVVVFEMSGAYSSGEEAFVEDLVISEACHRAEDLLNSNALWYDDDATRYNKEGLKADTKAQENSGYFYKIKDERGKTVFSNYDKGQAYTYTCKYEGGAATVDIYINTDTAGDSKAKSLEIFAHNIYKQKTAAIFYAIISFILAIFVFAFLIAGAGRREGTDEIRKRFTDKIPGDVYTVAAGFAETALVYLCFMSLQAVYEFRDISVILGMTFATVIAMAGFALFMIYVMSMAVQFKLHCFCRGTLIGRILILCRKIILKIPYMWRTMLVTAVILFINLVIIMMYSYDSEAVFFFIVEGIVVLAGVCYAALNLNKLRAGGQAIAEGNTDYKVDTDKMFFDFKKHGENLNSINESISLAVEKQLKSERMKTELITNVSHDIKTPLTSIINYTELLKQEKLDNEKAEEYIGVLDKQAARLKKLTEDIVEASKASTGNLPVELRECSLGMILNQALGEYEDKLLDAGLKPVVNIADDDMRIMADGRHLWRIIDNLLGNICKYAQSGTRVYLDVYRVGNKAVMSFKNISKYELNISADELMERFVRGDESRNTEGSGLGLSIAGNLAALQGGELKLAIDGDLFKATVEFNVI